MEGFVDFVQMFVGDVGIDLRRGNVGVAKECLHTTQVGAVFQKISREGVADDVRGHFAGNTSEGGIFFNQTLDRAWSKPPARRRFFFTPQVATHLYKQRIIYIAAFVQVFLYTALGSRGEKYHTHLLAFASHRKLVAREV